MHHFFFSLVAEQRDLALLCCFPHWLSLLFSLNWREDSACARAPPCSLLGRETPIQGEQIWYSFSAILISLPLAVQPHGPSFWTKSCLPIATGQKLRHHLRSNTCHKIYQQVISAQSGGWRNQCPTYCIRTTSIVAAIVIESCKSRCASTSEMFFSSYCFGLGSSPSYLIVALVAHFLLSFEVIAWPSTGENSQRTELFCIGSLWASPVCQCLESIVVSYRKLLGGLHVTHGPWISSRHSLLSRVMGSRLSVFDLKIKHFQTQEGIGGGLGRKLSESFR